MLSAQCSVSGSLLFSLSPRVLHRPSPVASLREEGKEDACPHRPCKEMEGGEPEGVCVLGSVCESVCVGSVSGCLSPDPSPADGQLGAWAAGVTGVWANQK